MSRIRQYSSANSKVRNLDEELETNTTRDETEMWKCATEEKCCLVPDTAGLV